MDTLVAMGYQVVYRGRDRGAPAVPPPNPTRRHVTATDPDLDGVVVLRFGDGEER